MYSYRTDIIIKVNHLTEKMACEIDRKCSARLRASGAHPVKIRNDPSAARIPFTTHVLGRADYPRRSHESSHRMHLSRTMTLCEARASIAALNKQIARGEST